MSKNTQYRKSSWVQRSENALLQLHEIGIQVAVAVVFGLGETHENRLNLIDILGQWRKQYSFPQIISLNWAVQHPLNGSDKGTQYTYTEWGTPEGPFIQAFSNFGEASVRYPLAGVSPPILSELIEINEKLHKIPLISCTNDKSIYTEQKISTCL